MPAKILNPPTPQIQKPRDLIKLDDLEGETTFAQAIRQASFPLHLPAFPSDLGQPDRAFVQDLGGAMVVFVWTEEDNPERAELVLFQIAPGSWAGEKGAPPALQHTQVNGNPAIWAEGPYVLALKNGNRDFRRLIVGHVLIWEENGVTYRLESNLSLEQAEKIAESLAPLP